MKAPLALAAGAVAALALSAAAGSGGASAGGYRNPTAGRELVLQLPGMHRARVRRGLVYRRVGGTALRADVYRPRGAPAARRLPAVLLGGPPEYAAGKDSGQKVGWAQAIAASGLAAVAFDIRPDRSLSRPGDPASDVAAALAYVRARARLLGVDGSRLCTLGFSVGTAPWHLWAAMKDPHPAVRCNAVFYGPLDLAGGAFPIAPELAERFSALTYLRRHGARIPPLFVAKAGRERFAGINESIDRFAAAAREVGAEVRVTTHPRGRHGFDVLDRDARSRAVVREALAFLRGRLLAARPARSLAAVPAARRPPPLRLRQTCVTRAERRRVVRFAAPDGVRLIGVQLGGGPRGVVLAHQGGGGPADLCAWIPYARSLARSGYRVLVFDHRGFGSSGGARAVAALHRVDLDAVAATRELRRRGARTVVLGGGSLGGAAVLAAAARIVPPVQGVVSFSAPQAYVRVDAVAAVRRLTVPALFLAALHDGPFAGDARALYEAAAAPDKRLELVPGGAHGAPLLRAPAVRALVDAWIAARSARPAAALR